MTPGELPTRGSTGNARQGAGHGRGRRCCGWTRRAREDSPRAVSDGRALRRSPGQINPKTRRPVGAVSALPGRGRHGRGLMNASKPALLRGAKVMKPELDPVGAAPGPIKGKFTSAPDLAASGRARRGWRRRPPGARLRGRAPTTGRAGSAPPGGSRARRPRRARARRKGSASRHTPPRRSPSLRPAAHSGTCRSTHRRRSRPPRLPTAAPSRPPAPPTRARGEATAPAPRAGPDAPSRPTPSLPTHPHARAAPGPTGPRSSPGPGARSPHRRRAPPPRRSPRPPGRAASPAPPKASAPPPRPARTPATLPPPTAAGGS